jgi:hypothetical protein
MTPARTRGPMGVQDAADPQAGLCLAGGTPGPVGTGGDRASLQCSLDSASWELAIPVLSVDMGQMQRLLFAVAYAEAADRAATRRRYSAEVELGDPAQVQDAARQRVEVLMDELRHAMQRGPEALHAFVAAQEQARERARASLDGKFGEAADDRDFKTAVLGACVKLLSLAKFGSTVFIKTASISTGGAGLAIDLAYSGVQAGIEQAYVPVGDRSVLGVVGEETTGNIMEMLAEEVNQAHAEGLMTREEKNIIDGMIGNYRGNARKLAEQIKKLEAKLQRDLSSGRLSNLNAKRAKKIAKLQALRLKTVQGLVVRGSTGLAKRAVGRAATLYFWQDSVREAWGTMAGEWKASD